MISSNIKSGGEASASSIAFFPLLAATIRYLSFSKPIKRVRFAGVSSTIKIVGLSFNPVINTFLLYFYILVSDLKHYQIQNY